MMHYQSWHDFQYIRWWILKEKKNQTFASRLCMATALKYATALLYVFKIAIFAKSPANKMINALVLDSHTSKDMDYMWGKKSNWQAGYAW